MEKVNSSVKEENGRIRQLRILTDLVVQTLMTQPLALNEAEFLIDGSRKLALELFPDKGDVFDLIYMPRFRRALRESGLLRRGALRLVE